jgi:putative transposase
MENHVHLVVVPDSPASLSRMMQRLNTEYARWIHAKRNTAGHLWQARYYSVALDHRHFCAAMVYVEQNPSRAGLVSQPWQWPWSSAAAHLGLASSRLLNLDRWQAGHSPETWKLHLELGIYGAALEERIRDATRHGRPVGSDEFLASLESRLKRPIRLSLGGRPRKKPAASGRPPKVPACAAS